MYRFSDLIIPQYLKLGYFLPYTLKSISNLMVVKIARDVYIKTIFPLPVR